MKKTKRILSFFVTVLMAVLMVPVAEAVTTPTDAAEFNSHFYKAFDESLSWTNAKAYCENLGGHLVTITSAEEQAFVYSLIQDKTKNNYWLGGTDAENEGEWRWITGETWNYTNWSAGNGNDSPQKPDNYHDEDYLLMYRIYWYFNPAGTWNDDQNEGDIGGSEFYLLENIGFICEWDSHFPAGYVFERDSYHFSNYGEKISKEYFKTFYEPAAGESLYNLKKNVSKKGLCYGMTFTTAAIYNGYPAVSQFAYLDFLTPKTATKIRDLDKIHFDSFLFHDIDSIAIVNNNALRLDDYIKYAFIYQWSAEDWNDRQQTWSNNIQELYQVVKDRVDNDQLCIALSMIHYDKDENGEFITDDEGNNISSGHTVLVVGYTENEILIDDPNSTTLQRITINDDGAWSFSNPWESDGVNNENTMFYYSERVSRPYELISTGSTTTVREQLLDDTNATKLERYVDNMERSDAGNALITFTNMDISLNCEIVSEVNGFDRTNQSSEPTPSKKAFWVKDDGSLNVQNESIVDNLISVARDNSLITSTLKENASLHVNGNEAILLTKKNTPVYYSIKDVQEYSDSEFIFNGLSNSNTITFIQTDTGVTVTGLNDMTITYSVNDEIVDETTVNVTDGREVIVQVDDEEGTIEVTHEHDYASEVTTAPTCKTEGVRTFTCTVCGDTYTEPVAIDPDAHDMQIGTFFPGSCTEDSYTPFVCTRCGYEIKTDLVSAPGHAWDDGEIILAPTCSSTGTIRHTCKRDGCGATMEKTLPADPDAHVMKTTVTPPTCHDDGYTSHMCTKCRYGYSDSIVPALGHTAPDEHGDCARCGTHLKDVCPWCGGDHVGFFQGIIGFFHRIFAAIFGARY